MIMLYIHVNIKKAGILYFIHGIYINKSFVRIKVNVTNVMIHPLIIMDFNTPLLITKNVLINISFIEPFIILKF